MKNLAFPDSRATGTTNKRSLCDRVGGNSIENNGRLCRSPDRTSPNRDNTKVWQISEYRMFLHKSTRTATRIRRLPAFFLRFEDLVNREKEVRKRQEDFCGLLPITYRMLRSQFRRNGGMNFAGDSVSLDESSRNAPTGAVPASFPQDCRDVNL